MPNDVDLFPTDPAESSDIDSDGIGDNSDPDRDGDGYSNTEEADAGTDPADPASFPDREPPALSLDGLDQRETEAESLTLSGAVADSGSGLAAMSLGSDRFPATHLAVQVDQGHWSVTVPLEIGFNQLTLVATDAAGNQAQLQVLIERTDSSSPLGLSITYPLPGSVLETSRIAVLGTLRSNTPAQQMTVTANGVAATLSPTEDVTRFAFQSQEIDLQQGSNSLAVIAVVDGQTLQTVVTVTYRPAQAGTAAPSIQVLAPAGGRYLAETGFTLAGEVTAEAGLDSLTLEGQPIEPSKLGEGHYSFREPLSFPEGQSGLSVEIQATDTESRVATLQVDYQLDDTPPQILLDSPLAAAPSETAVTEQPYHLIGTVIELHLASLSLNDQIVGVKPAEEAGQYRFDVPVTLASEAPSDLTLSATDSAGNQQTEAYRLRFQATASVEILLPAADSQLLNLGEPIPVQVSARLQGSYSAEDVLTLRALDDAGTEVATVVLQGEGGLRSATLTLPGTDGDYLLSYRLASAAGEPISRSTRSLTVKAPDVAELALERVEPANGEQGVEPNAHIALYFNQPIDIDKLSVQVYETAQGLTYTDADTAGAGPLESRGYQLTEVARSHQPVPGRLSQLPDATLAAFYPERELAYAAEVYVEVGYDGQPLDHLVYYTRPLPTFVSGGVIDPLGQAVAGLTVSLPELGRETTTNRDGAFAFGYGDPWDRALPGGRYQLVFNPGLKDLRFASLRRWINIQSERRNPLETVRLPLLNQEEPFVPVSGGESVILARGVAKLDLTEAQLLFPDGRRQGDVQAQFLDVSQIPYRLDARHLPHWAYAIQPAGVTVEGTLNIDLAVPELNQGYEYLPAEGSYVLLLGLDEASGQVVPVGVGQLAHYRVTSVGQTHYQSLDLLAYVLMAEDAQALLEQYAGGQIDLPSLRVGLRALEP